MSEYIPDNWCVVKIQTPTESFYKVLGSWYGGYLYGNSWRMNSGIVRVEDQTDHYVFHGHSGSRYVCGKQNYGAHSYSMGIVDNMIDQGKNQNTQVEVLPEQTDWTEIVYD
jgi:hypothetical protein